MKSNVRTLPPVQYNFAANWLTTLRPILKRPAVVEEFEKTFLNAVDTDEKIIYWEYKPITIDFVNPITKRKDTTINANKAN